jgi:hypothetical protein
LWHRLREAPDRRESEDEKFLHLNANAMTGPYDSVTLLIVPVMPV